MFSVGTFTAILNQLLPEPHAGLLNGILFGTKATIPKDFMDALIATGTLHIVALSGMNITILETIIGSTLLPFIGRRWASALTILLIIGFIWFVGLSPSVIRAGIMGSMALIATIFGRQKWSIFFFAVTVAVMLAIHPAWIGDLSFQLSAGATLGIILFGGKQIPGLTQGQSCWSEAIASPSFRWDSIARVVPSLQNDNAYVSSEIQKIEKNKNLFGNSIFLWFFRHAGLSSIRFLILDAFVDSLARMTKHTFQIGSKLYSLFYYLYSLVEDDLRITLAAQTFTIPLIFFTFRRVSLISPLTNVLIGWIIQPLTALGFVVAILGWIFLPLGQMAAWFAWVCLQYLIIVIELTAKIPFASLGF